MLIKKIGLCCLATLIILTLFVTPCWSVNAQKLITETQQINQAEGQFNLVWWIPNEFWESQNMKEDDLSALLSAIGDYCVVCVVDAQVTSLGSVIPQQRESLLPILSLELRNGIVLQPLADQEISSDALNLFAMMKPVMANMLGQFGQGMEFICFTGIDSSGQRVPDPLKGDSFTLKIAEKGFTFKLPLASLLPMKKDPATLELFPGNYMFNPYTGKKLIVQ